MYRSEIRPGPDQSAAARNYQPRIVVKLRDREEPRANVAALAAGESGSGPPQLNAVSGRFPGAAVTPLATSVSGARVQALVREAERASGRPVPNLANFFAVTVPRGTSAEAMTRFARDQEGVQAAYVQGAPTPPPVTPGDDPRAVNQRYLLPTATGVDARYAWTIPGGDGRGITVIDIEQGWTLNHEDLAGAGIALLSGVNQAYPGHGTAVLGELVAQDNTRGCVGVVPLATAKVLSQYRTASNYSTYDAIIAAIVASRPGDVILLEAQTTIGGSNFLPVEVDLDVWAAISVATTLGRIVIEAAGNGNTDLDTYRHPTDGLILKPGHAQFRDSGAILVGAATAGVPHSRLTFTGTMASQGSNYGARVNCYGHGERIDTTGDGWTGTSTTAYTTSFGGTSGASPIVTGAAIALLAMNKLRHGTVLSARRVREILSDPRNGTRTNVPAADRIGCMPDLRKIITNLSLAPAPAAARTAPPARTHAVAQPLVAALIDAGHGGEADEQLSTAYGSPIARPHTVAREKDINLELARRVCAQLGTQGVLSRSGDYNLSLRQRIERARAANAAAFVSIHSNTGRTDRPGPEVWVYGGDGRDGGPASQQLAQRIGRELAAIEASPVPVRTGRLAVLRPELHGPGVAACLVETGSLQHPGGAARLSSQHALDQISAAVARGVETYLAHDFTQGAGRYGAVGTDDAAGYALGNDQGGVALADESDQAVAQVCFHESAEDTQANWWDSDLPAGALVDTAPAQLRTLLAFLGVSYATFAPHEGAYLRALSEHLQRHGTIPAGTSLDRATFADAVRTFQTGRGIVASGVPDEPTLWALQRDWALTRRIATDNVPADQVPGSSGYNRFRLRHDIVDRYNALRAAVRAAGGVITSAGSFRDLGATVTPGRSATSMHYSGLALDLATDTGMTNTRQQYLITQEGRRWRVWCRSESSPERTLDAVIWRNGNITTERVTAKCFDFTELAEANGFSAIGPRSTFPANYLSAEWWHFQCERPLVRYFSQFGTELLSLAMYTESSLSRHTDVWANRMKVFKRGTGGWH